MNEPTIKQILHTADGIKDTPMETNEERFNRYFPQDPDLAALEAQFREKAVEVLTECRRVLGPAEMHTLNEATCISIDAVLALHAEIVEKRKGGASRE